MARKKAEAKPETKPKAKVNAKPVVTGEKQDARDPKTGLFVPGKSGNPAGRPKGSRVKLEEDFISDLCEAWKTHGAAAIETLATTDVATFVRVAAGVIPKESKITVDVIDSMSVHELRDYISGEIAALGKGYQAPAPAGGKRAAVQTRRLN